MNQDISWFRTAIVLFLSGFGAIITWGAAGSEYRFTYTHQLELSRPLLFESISVGEFTPNVDGLGFVSDFDFLIWRDRVHYPIKLYGFPRQNNRLSVFETTRRKSLWRWIVSDTNTQTTNVSVSGGLTGVLNRYVEHEDGTSRWTDSLCAYRKNISPELSFRSIFHRVDGFGCGIRTVFSSIGAFLGNRNSFSHPLGLDEHRNELAKSDKNQSTSEPDQPIGRRFLLGLFGCVGGYGLAPDV